MEISVRATLCWLTATVAALAVSPASRQSAQHNVDTGLIDGTVVYPDGRPVNGATAYAEPLGRGLGLVIPHDQTDRAGHFTIHVPVSWFGKFAVTAKKEEEDYPPQMSQFYSNGKFQTVTLTLQHPAATIMIHLGSKAGVLQGAVTDAVTGAALNPCVEMRRASTLETSSAAVGLSIGTTDC